MMNQFLVRPLVCFGTVFYSLEVLPLFWQRVSLLNPIVYTVDTARYGFHGYADLMPTA